MSLKEGQWMYNLNACSENWQSESFDTKEGAVIAGLEEYNEDDRDQNYYEVGQIHLHIPSVNVDWLIDNVREEAYEQSGESADDWLDQVSREQQSILEERMNKVLIDWLKEVNEIPKFGTMTNVQTIQIEEDEEYFS